MLRLSEQNQAMIGTTIQAESVGERDVNRLLRSALDRRHAHHRTRYGRSFSGLIHMKIESVRKSAISSDDFREIVGYESGVQDE